MRSIRTAAIASAATLAFTTLIWTTPTAAQDDNYTSVETRAYLTDSCILQYEKPAKGANFLGAVVGIILPYIIDFVLDQTANELTKIRKYEFESNEYLYLYTGADSEDETGENETDPDTTNEETVASEGQAEKSDGGEDAATTQRFPTLNPKFTCVTVVTGRFHKDKAREFNPEFKEREGAKEPHALRLNKCVKDENRPCFTLEDAEKRLADFRIQIDADQIYSLYEGKFEPSDDKTAMLLRSRFLHIDRTNSSRAKRPGQTFSFSLSGPGQTPDSERHMLASLDFGEVKAGTTIDPSDFAAGAKGDKTGWVKVPGITKEALAAYQRDPGLKRYMPVLFTVKNTQVKEPGDAAKFIAGFLKGTKKDIASTITGAVKPEGAEKKEKDLLDAQIAVATARAEVEKAPVWRKSWRN